MIEVQMNDSDHTKCVNTFDVIDTTYGVVFKWEYLNKPFSLFGC